MPTLDPYSVLERVRRDVGRNALRARNGIRLATGAHPSVGCTPKDVVWRRGRTELWHYRNDDVRFVIAGGCLVVLIGAVLFSKRKTGAFGEESEIVAEAMAEHGLPEGASAGE